MQIESRRCRQVSIIPEQRLYLAEYLAQVAEDSSTTRT